MDIREKRNAIGAQIDALNKLSNEIGEKLMIKSLLLKAVTSHCNHEYEIIHGNQECGRKQCTICGNEYQYITNIGHVSIPVGFLRYEIRDYKTKHCKVMESDLSDEEKGLVKVFIEGELEKLKSRISLESKK